MSEMFNRLNSRKAEIQQFLISNYNVNNVQFDIIEWLFIDDIDQNFQKLNTALKKLGSNNKTGFFNALCIFLEVMNNVQNEFILNGFEESGNIFMNILK